MPASFDGSPNWFFEDRIAPTAPCLPEQFKKKNVSILLNAVRVRISLESFLQFSDISAHRGEGCEPMQVQMPSPVAGSCGDSWLTSQGTSCRLIGLAPLKPQNINLRQPPTTGRLSFLWVNSCSMALCSERSAIGIFAARALGSACCSFLQAASTALSPMAASRHTPFPKNVTSKIRANRYILPIAVPTSV